MNPPKDYSPILMDSDDAHDAHAADIARLKRANNLLRKAIIAAEWYPMSYGNGWVHVCPVCEAWRENKHGHHDNCIIKHALESGE